MAHYVMSEAEKEYLAGYDITAYERPSLATDMVVFSILNDGVSDNIRKLQKKSLKVLLIKRANYPYKDCWALPGGFLRQGEDVIETARRELYEETGVSDAYLRLIGAYGEPGRDPRGWIVSNTYMALVNGEQCRPRPGTDAWEARWFGVEVTAGGSDRIDTDEGVVSTTDYTLHLTEEYNNLEVTTVIREHRRYRNYHKSVSYEIVSDGEVAFDHAKIILNALLLLRDDAENNLETVFDLMPKLFTLTELQNAFEIILDRKLVPANFRRKIMDYVEETDQIIEGAGYRPAKLFKRNREAFYD